MLGVDVPLLSDWNGEATRAFEVAFAPLGMQDVPMRASFLVESGTRVVGSWSHGRDLPDLDAVIDAARVGG